MAYLRAPVAQRQRSRFVIGRLEGSNPPRGSMNRNPSLVATNQAVNVAGLFAEGGECLIVTKIVIVGYSLRIGVLRC